ncbi:protealysin inhibitor emfourin [Agreia sp. COWG]|uniref:protealysin inhibitor emfourin n=1 Tax=Agreia sp. COWG TaxID=2773266 RepID=UPI001928BAF2|nr:protealysin inhibitor emfourin [Agreia sp. COWG]CAD6000868.1 conserved protein of unknown function [Agreia sp. COWG]
MNIVVSRSGGVAGIVRTWSVQIEADMVRWQQIVDACPWGAAVDLDGDGRPDGFVYVIAVDSHRATVPESQLTGAWLQLVQRVQEAQRSERHPS